MRTPSPKPSSGLQIAIYECSCGAQHNSPDARVPVGWTQRAGQIWCTDCTRAGIPVRALRQDRQRSAA